MEFTACGTTAGYLLAGSVQASDPESAFAQVIGRVDLSLRGREKITIEIILQDSGKEVGRRTVVAGSERGQETCKRSAGQV
jgi:hypothetical protein